MKKFAYAGMMLALAAGTVVHAAPKPKGPKLATQPGVLSLYELTNFNGDSVEIVKARLQFPMEWGVRSVGIFPGESWDLCQKPKFKAPCITLTKSYADSSEAGVVGLIASARPTPKATASTAKTP